MQTIAGHFLETFSHVKTSLDINFSIIIGLFIAINIGYHIFDWYMLSHYSDTYFHLPFHRKRYVIKNILKAFYLMLTSVYVSIMITIFIWTGVWSTYVIHHLGLVYMMPDLISLIRVSKLDHNTVQHHISVIILASLNLFCDYSNDTYWRGMIIYAYMSTLTGMVNFYLGYRLIIQNEDKRRLFACIAYYNYLASIIINWSYQGFIIYTWLFYNISIVGVIHLHFNYVFYC
jgi:hypothetical protein